MPAPALPRLTLTLETEDTTTVLGWWALPDNDNPDPGEDSLPIDVTPGTPGLESAISFMREYNPIPGP